MSYAAFESPSHDLVYMADETSRIAYLRKVGGLTFLGLLTTAVVGLVSAFAITLVPGLASPMVSLGVMMGAYLGAQFIGRSLVRSDSMATQLIGFGVGTVLEGVAFGYLLLAAAITGMEVFGNPFMLVGQALGLTGLVSVGMLAYVATGPKELSFVKAGLAMLFLPMMALMGLQVVAIMAGWQLFGGVFGTIMSVVFVLVSTGGVLVQLNRVFHEMNTTQVIEGAFEITMGLLVLYWNILVLLMRLNRR